VGIDVDLSGKRHCAVPGLKANSLGMDAKLPLQFIGNVLVKARISFHLHFACSIHINLLNLKNMLTSQPRGVGRCSRCK